MEGRGLGGLREGGLKGECGDMGEGIKPVSRRNECKFDSEIDFKEM